MVGSCSEIVGPQPKLSRRSHRGGARAGATALSCPPLRHCGNIVEHSITEMNGNTDTSITRAPQPVVVYQIATAGLTPADIAVPIRSILRGQHNLKTLFGEVTGIDKEGRCVLVSQRRN